MAQREGYLFVDHSASPGLPPELQRRMGGQPGQKIIENATLTCCHCKTAVLKNPFRTRERHRCPKCSMKYVCDPCAFRMSQPDYVHTSHEAFVDQLLKGA